MTCSASSVRLLSKRTLPHRGHIPGEHVTCLRSWRSCLPHTNDIQQFRGRLADSLIQQLHPALKMRNGLCHGLTGYLSGSQRSAQLLWRLNGEDGRVSYEELQTSFNWLTRIPRVLSVLSMPSVVRKFDRCIDTAENRQW